MCTVPSSSMLISQPDSSTSFLMFLPPGPMRAPIFSGLIFTVTMRGAYLLSSLRGSARVLAMASRIARRGAGDARLLDGLGHDLVRDALELEVELEAGDALGGAGDLAVHVAIRVLPADDVGEEFVFADVLAGVFSADADADARDGARDGHTG